MRKTQLIPTGLFRPPRDNGKPRHTIPKTVYDGRGPGTGRMAIKTAISNDPVSRRCAATETDGRKNSLRLFL